MRTLTLERGCESSINPGSRVCMDWFHEVAGKDGKFHQDERAEICGAALSDYVEVTDRNRYITVVASKRERADCFNIRRNGTLKEVTNYLDCDFQHWLRKSYAAGERYAHVELGR